MARSGYGAGGGAAIPSGNTPMPAAFLIPRTVELNNVSLAAGAAPQPAGAGGYTQQGFSTIPAGTKRISYRVGYTGKSATSTPKFRIEFTNGTDNGGEMILDVTSIAASSGGYATANIYVETLPNPGPPGNNVTWSGIIMIQVPDNWTGIRLLVAEATDTVNPGVVSTAFTGAGGAGA